MNLRNRSVIVTDGTGFIRSYPMYRLIIKESERITVLDNSVRRTLRGSG
jgi:hypothetical protein